MKIVITGSCGYIGSSLSLHLIARGHCVTGIDNFNAYYSPEIKRHNAALLTRAGATVIESDLSLSSIEHAIADAAAIVHLAAQPGISATTPWEDYHRNNILATHRLLEAACNAPDIRFVNIATSSVYGVDATRTEESPPTPVSWYGVTKLAAEQEVLAAHRSGRVCACSLRLFSVFGERERPDKLFPRLVRALLEDGELPLFEGSRGHRRSFTYVGDICTGITAALENWPAAAGEIFNLGTDLCFTTGDAIETAEAIVGHKVRVKVLPPRPGDQAATHANIGKIRRILGWQPQTTLEVGLRRMIDWYRREVIGHVDWN